MPRLAPAIAMILLFGMLSSCQAQRSEQPTPTRRNVAYGEHNRLIGGSATNLDVYRPKTNDITPVVIWIHGGAWKIGHKRGVDEKPEFFNDRGMTLISINYRLVPEVAVATQAGDVAQAIEWVKQNAADLKIDPKRIVIMGHSAGAHLAALVATDESYLKAAGGDLSDVKGVILLDGSGYDVPRQIKEAPSRIARDLYLEAFGDNVAVQQKLSPVNHVEKNKGIPPFLILHCASRVDSTAQSNSLGEGLREAGGKARVVACKDKTHTTINRELGIEGDQPTAEVAKFLDELGLKAGGGA
ncbi:MAG: alpha/beta hydrolase [Planctomycetaceae bacterium]|nr:alpha/beta hydrolase [Planctomycetaceae bacterium]MCB9949672.1 alpha/beta hydrolase [Planctomycetaceae bacterium]